MKRIFTLIILCVPLSVNERVHTVLNKKTIAVMPNSEPIQISKGIKVKFKPRFKPTNKKFKDIIASAAIKHGVDAALVHAIIQTESAYNPTAVSNKGAGGLMQLMPDTAVRFGVKDVNNPIQNINGGTKYLKFLIELFDADLPLVVAAYNAGENAVIKYNHKIPPYPETKSYVQQVLALYNAS